MQVLCLDMEGVLVPEIWIEFSKRTGIPLSRLLSGLTPRQLAEVWAGAANDPPEPAAPAATGPGPSAGPGWCMRTFSSE